MGGDGGASTTVFFWTHVCAVAQRQTQREREREGERERERSFDELGGTEALVLGCGSISFASFYVSTTVRHGRRDVEVAVAIER
jgi:hypothetical protein